MGTEDNKLRRRIRLFAIAGYVLLPLQLFPILFSLLQNSAGVSIDLLNLGFGYFPTDFLFSIFFLISSVLFLLFGLSIGWFGRLSGSKFLYFGGFFIALLNALFLAMELFERLRRLPEAPFLLGFYQGQSPEWVFWILNAYTLLSLLGVVFLGISVIIFGYKQRRKMFSIAGIVLLLGTIIGVLPGIVYLGMIFSLGAFLIPFVGILLTARSVRVHLKH